MNTQQKKALILFGMHRSGISVLAGCLNLLGVNFGKTTKLGNQTNQPDFFENQDIILQHDILLRDLACRWDMVGSLPSDWLKRKAVQDARDKISMLIQKNFSGEKYWAIKDPRLCRLIPLWMDVFKQTDIEPCFVLMVRHPFEVARSLEIRDGFDLLKGHLLWLMHNREALTACSGHEYAILTYDDLLADPVHSMENISQGLRVDFPNEPKKAYQNLIDFVRPDLKHQNWGPQNKNENDMFSQYSWLYDQFRQFQVKALDNNTGGADISEVIPYEIMDQDIAISDFSSKALDNNTDGADTSEVIPYEIVDQGIAISDFPLITSGSNHSKKPEASHVSEMFNNLLNVISRYEQADLDRSIQRQRLLLTADQQGRAIYAQIYFPIVEDGEDYLEEKSQKILLAPDEWQRVAMDIPRPKDLLTGRLRLDPLNTRGMVSISNIKIIHAVTGDPYWSVLDPGQISKCTLEKDGLILSAENGFIIVCTGSDPRILLPQLLQLPDSPLRLEVWIKATRDQFALHDIWMDNVKSKALLSDKVKEIQTIADDRKKIIGTEGCMKDDALKQVQILQEQLDEKNMLFKTRIDELEIQFQDESRHKDVALKQVQVLQEQLDEKNMLFKTRIDELEIQLQSEIRLKNDALQQVQASKSQLESEHTRYSNLLIKVRQLKQQFIDSSQALHESTKIFHGKLEKKEASLTILQKQISTQKGLTRQYHTALSETERENLLQITELSKEIQGIEEKLKDKNSLISDLQNRLNFQVDQSNQLIDWMYKLNDTFQHLLTSGRWRIGNAIVWLGSGILLRPKRPLQADVMSQIFRRFERTEKQDDFQYKPVPLENNLSGEQLITWIQDLQWNFHALKLSRRWKIGQRIGKLLDMFRFEPKIQSSPDYILDIFSQFTIWYHNTINNRPERSLSQEELKMLINWLRELDEHFQSLIAARRWRLGNAIGRFARALVLRQKAPVAVENMKQILDNFSISISK